MTARFCKKCGDKIPRKYKSPHGTSKKTKQNRKHCFNCSPVRFQKTFEHGHHQNHVSERRRRKEILVKMLGGHCVKCGYNHSVSALSFHHKRPETKKFHISSNGCLMQDWDIVLEEARKCELLCLNCHAEHHNDS